MGRIKRWVAAVFGLAPMGTTEALVLIAAGAVGAVSVHGVFLQATDPLYWWFAWWVGLAASAALLVRGVFAFVTSIGRRVGVSWRWLNERLPVEFRSPIIWKVPTLVIPPSDAPLGFLDFQLAFERALDTMTKIANRMVKDQSAASRLIASYTPRFATAVGTSTGRQHDLSREYAKKLLGYTGKMDRSEQALGGAAGQLAENGIQRIRSFPANAPAEFLRTFRQVIEMIRNPVVGARESTIEFRSTVGAMRNVGVQQDVNAAADSLFAVLERLIEDYGVIIRFGDDALAEIDSRIPAVISEIEAGSVT